MGESLIWQPAIYLANKLYLSLKHTEAMGGAWSLSQSPEWGLLLGPFYGAIATPSVTRVVVVVFVGVVVDIDAQAACDSGGVRQ